MRTGKCARHFQRGTDVFELAAQQREIRHHAAHGVPKARTVVHHPQVAQLMHYHVVDHRLLEALPRGQKNLFFRRARPAKRRITVRKTAKLFNGWSTSNPARVAGSRCAIG